MRVQEKASNVGFNNFWWVVNSYADKLADQGAAANQLGALDIDKINSNHKDVITILRHHVDVAVHLAPDGARPSLVGQVGQPTLSKCDRVGQLAREAGHQLDSHGHCV